MEDGKQPARVQNSDNIAPPPILLLPPPPPPPSSSSLKPAPATMTGRQRFTVELRPGETTIVSWKKLIKDSSNKKRLAPLSSDAPSGAHPALESRIAPTAVSQAAEGEIKDAPPSNRFSAVIEKIERLYMGEQSSDEELDNVPDDDEYDTEDSFIDDAELDEYFQVDKSPTKHSGFFVNRGKLERGNEPSLSPTHTPKKRRKDFKSRHEKDGEQLPKKHVKLGNVRMKAAARGAPLVGTNLSSLQTSTTPSTEHCQVEKSSSNQMNATHVKCGEQKLPDQFPQKRSNMDASMYPMEANKVKKHKTGGIKSKDLAYKSRTTGGSLDATHTEEFHSRKFWNDSNEIELSTKASKREKGSNELLDMNSSGTNYPSHIVRSPSMPAKESSNIRPKGTMLERAIRDLEKMVADSKSPTMELQEVEVDAASQGLKRRLPQDIKLKLAKVARLAQSSQGRISEELINRLMSILGHHVQLKTLKRHLKEMVELGLSAKQKKADRFEQVKKEVIEMIKARVPSFESKVAEQRDGSSDDFQEVRGSEEKGALQVRYKMDEAMEDKIRDLYELYVEGMDEDRGPQSRKLYVELAELWPNGAIDSNGIKSAVNRSKGRKRHKDDKKMMKKRTSPSVKTETTLKGETSLNAQPRAVQVSSSKNLDGFISSPTVSAQNQFTSNKPSILALHAPKPFRPKLEKIKGSTAPTRDGFLKVTDGGNVKKKLKRKPDMDLVEVHGHPTKLPSQHREKERQKSHKQSAPVHQNPSFSSVDVPPGCEQPS